RFAAEDVALGEYARQRGYHFAWVEEGKVFHENPLGWRGYARKMRQVGRYHSAVSMKPPGIVPFTALHTARAIKCAGREFINGDHFEATAQALKVFSQVSGA